MYVIDDQQSRVPTAVRSVRTPVMFRTRTFSTVFFSIGETTDSVLLVDRPLAPPYF